MKRAIVWVWLLTIFYGMLPSAGHAQDLVMGKTEILYPYAVKLPGEETFDTYGYLTITNGKWRILPHYQSAQPFDEEQRTALVGTREPFGQYSYDWKYANVDRNGVLTPSEDPNKKWLKSDGPANTIENYVWQGPIRFSEERAVVQVFVKNNGLQVAVIDRSGTYIALPAFVQIKPYSQGLAACQVDRNKEWGFLNKQGQIEIAPKYEDAGAFGEGLAPVKKDGKWGFITSNGVFAIAAKFDAAGEFAHGVAKVGQQGKYGWIDKKGNWVVKPLFQRQAVLFYEQGIVLDGNENGAMYYCNLDGQHVYHYANFMTDGYAAQRRGDYPAALQAFHEALKVNPQDAAATWAIRLVQDSIAKQK